MNESEEETLNPEVDSACNEAIAKLDTVIQEEKSELDNINKKKKEIVVEFAERLDNLLSQKDTISSIIVKTLKGRVGKSLIHGCLPAKYKKEHRRRNTLKRKKKKVKIEPKLAPLSELNQQQEQQQQEEEEKKKQKVTVMVGADGRSYYGQSEDNEKPSDNESEDYPHNSTHEKDNTPADHVSTTASQQLGKELQSPDNKDLFNNEHEQQNQSFDNMNEQQKTSEPSRQLTDKEQEIEIMEDSSVEDSIENNDKDLLSIEFPVPFTYLQYRIDQLHLKIGDNGLVWCNIVVSMNRRKVVSYNLEESK